MAVASASAPGHGGENPRIRRGVAERILVAVVVIAPSLVTLWAAIFWKVGYSYLALAFLLYVLTGLGVTIGYHRLATHKSFETYNWIRAIFLILAICAIEGDPKQWIANHWEHHKHSDKEGDPHSPHHSFKRLIWGFLHAHFAWLLRRDKVNKWQYAKLFEKDKLINVLQKISGYFMVLSFVLPAIIGGMLGVFFEKATFWVGFWHGFIWAGVVRVCITHHITWSVNSVCHIWGNRPFKTDDESRNNWIFGLLSFGEGWHNNHHQFQASAFHGLKWYQPDLSGWIIRLLERLKLAWNVRYVAFEEDTGTNPPRKVPRLRMRSIRATG